MEDYLRIGYITKPHGIRGEVKVCPTTDDKNRFKKCKEVYLDYKGEKKLLHVEQVKFFKEQVILKFEEYSNINEIELFRTCDILVTREQAVPLEEGEYFLCDIMDAEVFDIEGKLYGNISEILQTGANDVYVVKNTDGKEILLPVIDECIKEVDVDNKRVVFQKMNGLME